jgi:hypothetical protein
LNNSTPEIPIPEVCASRIFEMSGAEFEPDIAFEKDKISFSRI